MEHIHVILYNSFYRTERMRLGLSIPSREPEQLAAAHHRHLPHGGGHRVPPKHGEGAPVVLPFGEGEVHGHEEPKLALRRRGVDPLRPSHNLGGGFGLFRQGVVHHDHRTEERRGLVGGRGRRDSHRGLVLATDNVMEEEVEVA